MKDIQELYKEVKSLYDNIVEDTNNPIDLLLKINDLYSIILLIVSKSIELSPEDKKGLILDSIKPMTNNYISHLMKIVSENELKTIDNDK